MARLFNRAEIPLAPDLRHESALWTAGVECVAGIDEAGRGAWAGPVVAGAVILPSAARIAELLADVRDSKQMLPAARAYWAKQICQHARAWGVGLASSCEIDQIGIVPATMLAMRRAVSAMRLAPDHCLVDALHLPGLAVPQSALIKGDARSLSIAAASVLAKTARDALMVAYEDRFPGYGFARHKGYGTAIHWAALQEKGPAPIHRASFAPVVSVLARRRATT